MRAVLRASLVTIVVLFLTTPGFAQEIVAARIAGTITDQSGSVLPGVTATLTSPVLQVPQVVQVSDERGEYQFLDLRPGTYRVNYELAGFNTLSREGIILTTGFAARVDVSMKIGNVAETITVSGASPVIDVVNTRGGATVTTEVIEAIPNGKILADIAGLAGAAVQYRGAPAQGEAGERVTLAESSGTLTYGQSAATSVGVEGIRAPVNEAMDWNVADEVNVGAYGNGAEQDGSGARIGLVVKSGGNDFHGTYRTFSQHDRFTANNIDDALRNQGLTSPDAVQWYYDVNGDLGGRIFRDKLWFYGALRRHAGDRTVAGSSETPGADGIYGNADDPVGHAPAHTSNQTLKVSNQLTRSHRFVGFFMRDDLIDETEDTLSRYVPFESTAQFRELGHKAKGEWQGLFGNRLLASALVGFSGYKAWRITQPGSENLPSQFDVASQENRGARFTTLLGWRIPNSYPQASGGLTYLPNRDLFGTHKLQLGGRYEWREFISNFDPAPAGDYQLRYNTIGGVPHQPFQIVTVNRPVIGNSRQNAYTLYGADEWRLNKRVTMNLGLRWERHVNWVPPQSREAGTFSPAASFPAIDAGTWHDIAPRTGIAFDLSGDGKTVVKGTYGRYYSIIDISFANDQNKNTISTSTYTWHDLNRDGLYQTGEVNLDPNGTDFVSIAGGNVNTPASDDVLRMPYTDEMSASIERELIGGVAIRGLYVYKVAKDQFSNVNILRPLSVWNRQFTRTIPGPDGVVGTSDDGGSLTIFDYDPAYRGAAFVQNMNVNRPDGRDDSYNNFELGLRKRGTQKWLPLTVSFLATKNHRWLTGVPQSPNDDLFPLDETWAYTLKMNGGYLMPHGISVAADFAGYSGVPSQETYLFPASGGAAGPSFPSSTGGQTLRVGTFGDVAAPNRFITNARASKSFRFSRSSQIKVDFDIYNLFNTNVPWSSGAAASVSFLQGPTYGQIERVMTPRVARFGVTVVF
jgi:hypothetical protein